MTPPHIPLIYRLFHLWIEPLVFIPMGAYLAHSDPYMFIASTSPAMATGASRSSWIPKDEHSKAWQNRVLQLLATNTAGLYLMLGLVEALALRATRELNVWRSVLFAILVSDLAHLGAWYVAAEVGDPGRGLDLSRWNKDEWTSTGLLMVGAVLRLAFLLGVGLGRPGKRAKTA